MSAQISLDVLRKMEGMGLTLSQAISLLEDMRPKRTANAERQARFRAKKAQSVTCNGESNGQSNAHEPPRSPPRVSPTPPSDTPPISPQKHPTLSQTAAPHQALDELVDTIHELQPPKHRRSTRPDIRRKLEALRGRTTKAEVLAACRAYYDQPDCHREDGMYAMGAARLLASERWRDFIPPPPTVVPFREPTAADIADRLERYRLFGEWREHWGPRPEEQAA